MRILVVGAGSTGGYFGGRLAEAGRNVTFLVRPARAARLSADGLRIKSPHGDLTLAPKLLAADEIDGPYDAVLLAVKAFGLVRALDDVAPAIGPETMILPVLNGMGHIDAIVARFGRNAPVGCVCKVSTVLDDDGCIAQLNPLQELAYGEMNGAWSARMEWLDTLLQGAGFTARLSNTIEREMWEKWAMLATVGGVTNLMRGTVGEVEAVEGGADFALAFLDEVLAVVTAEGHPPSGLVVEEMRTMMTQKGSLLTSSMYRDMTRNRPVEVDQILGDLIVRARRLGIPTPLLGAAFINLSVYQRRLRATPA